ncbi:hypothetical protein TELCIR_05200 [Teladorsagia circumcincta]|uniref:G-protein coupled receptors family 1 profile domain-containing protein n=1 Tax=Teladorsagia circumcincta TaxID=45464 RepID=A0A2G9URQ7_TELCI|nr:hypothetical protein TELCIR_05200 [Teladorsagia circumcincta]
MSDAGSVLWAIAMAVLSIVTVVGNLAVLLSYYLDKNIRHPSNYFIFSLAVSDLLMQLMQLGRVIKTNGSLVMAFTYKSKEKSNDCAIADE